MIISRWIGIDPGLYGAIAYYTPVTGGLEVFDTPIFHVTVNGKRRRRLDKNALNKLLSSGTAMSAALEAVHSMPKQGVSSSFAFGEVFGATEQCLVCKDIPVLLVQPRKWKGFFGLSSDKEASRLMAIQKFPAHKLLFARKKDDGRAESALLALYGFLHVA